MKIQGSQRGSTSCNSSPGPKLSDDDSSETEGEFSPANSGVDPNFLRKIKKRTELSKLDQEVICEFISETYDGSYSGCASDRTASM